MGWTRRVDPFPWLLLSLCFLTARNWVTIVHHIFPLGCFYPGARNLTLTLLKLWAKQNETKNNFLLQVVCVRPLILATKTAYYNQIVLLLIFLPVCSIPTLTEGLGLLWVFCCPPQRHPYALTAVGDDAFSHALPSGWDTQVSIRGKSST